jgi:hypothetical protein
MVLIVLSSPLAAQASGSWRSGWFGDIRLGGGVVGAEPSGLDVYDDNEKRDRLGDDDADVSEGLPLIAGEIGYGFKSTGTMMSAGGGMEDPWFVSIGQKVGGWGVVSVSGLYEEGEVWENPYLTGVDRDETDAESFGFGLGWDGVMGTGLSVFANRMEVDVDRDRIGEIDPDLRRDGADTTIGIRYPWNLGAGGVLSGGIRYILIDRDGDANSGHGYAAELNHMLEWDRFSFATGLELVAREFDETHPVFNEKREEAEFTISETVSFAEPFGLKNATCSASPRIRKPRPTSIFSTAPPISSAPASATGFRAGASPSQRSLQPSPWGDPRPAGTAKACAPSGRLGGSL